MLPKGPSGHTSTSRSLAWLAFFIVMPMWLGIGAGLAFFGWSWDAWDGYMSWGVEFLFVSMLPTLGRDMSEAIQKKKSTSVTTTGPSSTTTVTGPVEESSKDDEPTPVVIMQPEVEPGEEPPPPQPVTVVPKKKETNDRAG